MTPRERKIIAALAVVYAVIIAGGVWEFFRVI